MAQECRCEVLSVEHQVTRLFDREASQTRRATPSTCSATSTPTNPHTPVATTWTPDQRTRGLAGAATTTPGPEASPTVAPLGVAVTTIVMERTGKTAAKGVAVTTTAVEMTVKMAVEEVAVTTAAVEMTVKTAMEEVGVTTMAKTAKVGVATEMTATGRGAAAPIAMETANKAPVVATAAAEAEVGAAAAATTGTVADA
uniref:mucin-5AC-like n=1 Tax=Gasterosteus aculeatus aculeatus TaxID=481459 RepID=UPI001A980212|nr:mucin-5AC-like [Gasterosteus aculeatus aculeatus]